VSPRLVAFPAPVKQDRQPAATPPNLGDILSLALSLEKQGYRANSVRGLIGGLKAIDRRTNLLDVGDFCLFLKQSCFN
jgi:hypothetical protein